MLQFDIPSVLYLYTKNQVCTLQCLSQNSISTREKERIEDNHSIPGSARLLVCLGKLM